MVPLLRTYINDLDETSPRYSDERLEGALVAAARLVVQELTFDNDYAMSVPNVTIAPDPTDAATRDEAFIDLVTVKAACVLDRGAAGLAAGQAIMVQDGSSRVDLRDAFKANLSLLEKGWCAVYAEMAETYANGTYGSYGIAIMTPFRQWPRRERPYLTERNYRR